MYTEAMHNRIKTLANKHYGKGLKIDEGTSGTPLGRELTFADIFELIEEIEELQLGVAWLKQDLYGKGK
jgi:hypothetical protein